MKKILFYAFAALTVVGLMTGCNSKKFKTTASGLMYRFEITNPQGQPTHDGDIIVGELTLKLDTTVLLSNVGNPDRIGQVAEHPYFQGLHEGLLMMHVGEKAVFAFPADSVARFLSPKQMPPMYQPGAGQMFYYEVTVKELVSSEEQSQEEANFTTETEARAAAEAGDLAKYIADNNITVKPTQSGLYIVVKKKGNGPKVAAGKGVAIDYTGRLLDGTIFDSSREADMKSAGKPVNGRKFQPLEYVVGSEAFIAGWEEGVMGQPAGTELTLVMPSRLAYGKRGAGQDILPYSPLVFDLTIVSVE